MDLHLSDLVVLVTRGASGIGLACVEAALAEGANVAIADRNPRGVELADSLSRDGHDVVFTQADLSIEPDVRRCVKETLDRFGRIDVVIACAGVSGPAGVSTEHITVEQWDQVTAVNVRGNFLLVKHTVPHLRQSGAAAMVFLASDSAMVAFEGMVPYTTSKGALLMLTKALSVEHPGIRVNCLSPSVVDTPMSRTDLGRQDGFVEANLPVMHPQHVAALALFLASPASAPINGTSLLADHGYLARSAQPVLEFS